VEGYISRHRLPFLHVGIFLGEGGQAVNNTFCHLASPPFGGKTQFLPDKSFPGERK